MRKSIIGLILVALLILSFKIAKADDPIISAIGQGAFSGATSIIKGFGGKIISAKAIEIQALESANYHCNVPGSSITIKPVGKSPTSYLIPFGVISKTKTPPSSSKWILGLHNQTKTAVVCIFQGEPPVEKTVFLSPITMYGTSR